jgi:hypothetical protein
LSRLNGGPAFKHSEAFSFQIATENQGPGRIVNSSYFTVRQDGAVEARLWSAESAFDLTRQPSPADIRGAIRRAPP